ncbi:hypothetical protein, partial [Thiolapillus sp.]
MQVFWSGPGENRILFPANFGPHAVVAFLAVLMNKRHPTVRPERQNLNPEIAPGRWIYSITQYSTMGYAYIGKIQSVTKPRS